MTTTASPFLISVCPWEVLLPQLPKVSVQILLVKPLQPVKLLEGIKNADEPGVILQILISKGVEPVLLAEVPENLIHKTRHITLTAAAVMLQQVR